MIGRMMPHRYLFMHTQAHTCVSALVGILLSLFSPVHAQDDHMKDKKIIIGHRGAAGYIPEHTLPGKMLAHEMGADFIEQDVVLSRDGVPIVLHDIYLDAVTNVASAFPDRARKDGRFYAIDFDAKELKSLHVNERIDLKTGKVRYAGRPAQTPPHLHLATLAEEIALIQGLNKSSGRNAGLYVELKSPALHRQHGKDITAIVLDTLTKQGYTKRTDNIFIQCFDPAELKRIRNDLHSDLKLIQLIGENGPDEPGIDFHSMRTPAGLAAIARYADGIGPAIDQIVNVDDQGRIAITNLVTEAHKLGLQVHTYTARKDALPEFVTGFDQLMELLFPKADVDGVFTDFPDLAVRFRDKFM